jgi:hypothetical protein
MMGAARTSETTLNFYQTTRRNIRNMFYTPRRRDNLKSHQDKSKFVLGT